MNDHGKKDSESPDSQTAEPAEVKDKDNKLPTVEEIRKLEDSLVAPQPLNPEWSPDAIVDGGPVAKAKEQVEDLKGELADCETFLEMGDRAKKMGIDLVVTKARIIELQKLIDKADKKVPAHKATAAELALTKERYLEKYKEKGIRAKKAAESARTNFVLLQQAQQKQAEYWRGEIQRTAEEQSKRQDQWAQREQDLMERHQEVLAEFEERANAMEDQEEQPAVLVASPQANQAEQPPTNPRQSPAFFELVAMDFDPDKLPTVPQEDLDNPTILAACGNLHKLLSHWMSAGAAVPFSFQQLAQEAMAGTEARELILRLLGSQSSLWFKDSPAADADLIPRQAVIAVNTVLGAAKQLHESSAERSALVKSSFTKITEQHQKRKAGASPYGFS